QMGVAFPELAAQQARIEQVLKQEEERFGLTLEHGMKILEAALAELPNQGQLDGQTVFTLYDTYGFPVDLTADICRERDIQVDIEGFESAMARQRAQARAAGKFKMDQQLSYDGDDTRFEGYEQLQTQATVVALYHEDTAVSLLQAGERGIEVLGQRPL